MKTSQVIRLRPEAEAIVLAMAKADGIKKVKATYLLPLLALAANKNTIQRVAHYIGVTQQGAGKLLRNMERDGFVELHTTANDRRVRRINPTETGQQLIEIIKKSDGVELPAKE